jgi:hypothetical protein
MDEVDAQLRQQVIAGNVIEHETTAPNGRPAMAYELSAHFKGSVAYRTMTGTATGAPQAEPAQGDGTVVAPSAPAGAPAAPDHRVVQHRAGVKKVTNVDRAIAFLVEHRSATSNELRELLNLPSGVHPSSYLTSAVHSGRILRDGDCWTLPAEIVSTSPKSPAAPQQAKEQANAEQPTRDESMRPLKELRQALRAPAGYRCALWSDDVLEVQRDGVTVAELPKAAGETLAAFLGRLAREAAPA